MEIFLIILAVLCALAGVAGSVLPVLPGPPVSYLGLILMQLSGRGGYSTTFMIATAVLTIAVVLADYFLPPWITRRFGGSQYAAKGSLVGMIAGIFLTPVGMVLGSLIGAFVGEYVFAKRRGPEALRATLGSFIGFIAGTGIKLLLTVYIVYAVVRPLF